MNEIKTIAKWSALRALANAMPRRIRSGEIRAALEANGACGESYRNACISLVEDGYAITGSDGKGYWFACTPKGMEAFAASPAYTPGAEKEDANAITNAYWESEQCEGSFGITSWLQWCELELERLAAKGDKSAHIAHHHGRCWLTRSPGRQA